MIRHIIAYFIKYSILSNILIAVLVAGGLLGFFALKTSYFPETEVRVINVSIAYPGASPEEMEEGITLKIEQAIKNIAGIDEISSTSSENSADIRISVLKGYNLDEVYTEVKNAVDRINSLPVDAERPVVFKQKFRNLAQWVALSGDVDLATLKRYAEDVKDELLAEGVVSQINIVGVPNTEISIEVSEENLLRYGLTFDQVASAVKNNNKNISAGSIKASSEELLIRSNTKKSEADRISEIILRANADGGNLLLRDIAQVKEQFEEVPNYSTLNGKTAIFIRIEKLIEEDLGRISKYMKEYTKNFNAIHQNIQMTVAFDSMKILQQRLDLLINNGTVGLILVLVSLGFFLSLRLSMWVAWGIPASFLGMFMIAGAYGITINVISLFGMILVIGILVDDGIVIAENIFSHFEKGKPPHQAALDGTMEVLPAVTTSVTTTIVAFTPLLMLSGGFEFLFEMAFVVVFSLIFSLIEAFLILPSHLASKHILRVRSKNNVLRYSLDTTINFLKNNLYGKALQFTMKYKWVSVACLIALFPLTIGLMQGGFIKTTFFPDIPFFNFDVNLIYKPGTREEKVATKLEEFERKIWELNQELKQEFNDTTDYIDFTFAFVGGTNDGSESGAHAGSLSLFHREFEKSDPISARGLLERVRKKIGKVPEAEKLTVGSGGRWGKPVYIRLQSKNTQELTEAKEFLKTELEKFAELKEVQDDAHVGKRELSIDLLPKAYFLGLSQNEVVKQVRQGFFGEEVQRLQKGTEEVKVWVRYPKKGRKTLGQFEDMRVKVGAKEYPMQQVADYRVSRGIADIKHYETARTVAVEADMIDPEGDVANLLARVKEEIIPVVQKRYNSVKVSYGGQAQESSRGLQEIVQYFGTAACVIAILIMIHFKSFYQTVMILAMIPLGWIGAILGHGIIGIPVSILSFWGLIALSGVIINDAVVFLDRYNRNLLRGMKVYDAAYDAGLARFRPIILTSVTTVLGLFPIIYETTFSAQFLKPMAVAIAFGVLIGTFVILLFFPVIILYFNTVRFYAKWLWVDEKPIREKVERAIIDIDKESLLQENEYTNAIELEKKETVYD